MSDDTSKRWARAILNRVRAGDRRPSVATITRALTILGDIA